MFFAAALLLLLGSAVVWLSWPVCMRIPDDALPVAERVSTLKERAARGEPFEQKEDGHWYQCKSRLARMYF